MKNIAMLIDNAAKKDTLAKNKPKRKPNDSYYLFSHVDQLPIKTSAKTILRALVKRGVTSYASLKKIANDCFVSISTVIRNIKILAQKNLIKIKKRRCGSINMSNVYTINPEQILLGGTVKMTMEDRYKLKAKDLVLPKNIGESGAKTQQVFANAENQMPQPQIPEPPLPLAETEALQSYRDSKTAFSCLPEDLPKKMPQEAVYLTAIKKADTNATHAWDRFKKRAMGSGEALKSIQGAFIGFMDNWRGVIKTQSSNGHASLEKEMSVKSRVVEGDVLTDKPKYKFWSKQDQEKEDPYRICPADVMIYEEHQKTGKPLPDHLAARYAQQPWLIDANWRQKMGKSKSANTPQAQLPGPAASIRQNEAADLWAKKSIIVPGKEPIAFDEIVWD